MASLYRRGKIWWSKSYEAGKMARASLGTRDKAEARRRLREREAQVVRGERPTTSNEPWDAAAADLVAYYRAYGSRNVREAEGRLKQLARYFGGMKLAEIDAAAILGYVAHRQKQGQAAATINVDLGTLRKALRLAQEYGKLATVPRIKMLRPAPPRQGFFERAQFEAEKAALPPDLALVMTIAFLYGWRIPSEVLTLTKATG